MSRFSRGGVSVGNASIDSVSFNTEGERFGDVLAFEGAFSGQHLVQHNPKRPDVGALVNGLAPGLLRGHVGRGAYDHPRRCALIGQRGGVGVRCAGRGHGLGEAEVEDLDRAVGADLDVRGLEITMNDALLMRGFQRFRDLSRDGQDLGDGNGSARDVSGEVFALDEFHDEGA